MQDTAALRHTGARATAYDFVFPGLGDADPVALADFAGKAILVVNVGAACSFTPQYRELQQLWDAKHEKGLVILGVPANDFARQSEAGVTEITSACTKQYGVTFPLTGKVEVAGAHRHPFYDWVRLELGEAALPKWNFHKILVDRAGALVRFFPPTASPLGPEILSHIKAALTA